VEAGRGTWAYAVDGLVQDNLSLIQLLLNLGNAAGIVCILEVCQILLQRSPHNLIILVGALYRCDRLFREKLVHEFRKDAVRSEIRVILGDDHTGNTLGAGVAVNHIVCFQL